MALGIEDPETEHLAWRLAQLTGETVVVATKRAIEERLNRIDNLTARLLYWTIWLRSANAGANCR